MWGDYMFTKICLRNFRSFDKIEFDLSEKTNKAKPLAIVYGENGAGKSNLMSAFVLLNEIMQTMNIRDAYEDILDKKIFDDDSLQSKLQQKILASMRDIKAIITDYRMVGSSEHIVAEYSFLVDDKLGQYTIELGNEEIVHERLEYVLTQRKGVYFDCSNDDIFINSKIIGNKDFLVDVKSAAKRFWGKHSILAIVLHELQDKANAYGKDSISDKFNDVLESFSHVCCSLGIGSRHYSSVSAPYEILKNAASGEIGIHNEQQLDVAETVLTSIYSSINSSIRRAYYDRKYTDDMITYQLFFEKKISGKYRNIAFSKESTGNHQILSVLCYLFCACMGATVVLDEADSGIHDFLFKKIVEDIYSCIKGQVILSTHNTLLMETNFSRNSTYIIKETETGSKEICTISSYNKRTYINNNIRDKYLGKEYGGIPTVVPIDFKALLGKSGIC